MKKFLIGLGLISSIALGTQIIPESVSIGTKKPHASASLDLNGTSKGFLMNKLTSVQRDAIASPATGLLIYNTTVNAAQIYDGAVWTSVGGGAGVAAWDTGVAYAINTVVVQNNKLYVATSIHTSGVFATDLAANKWNDITNANNFTGVVAIANGGTNAASQNAPVASINPIAFYDGTSITTDATPSHLGYNASTDTVHSSHINISSNTTQTAKFTNTAASGSSSGAGMQGYSDDGAALANGDRLGFYSLGGATDSSHTTSNASLISGFATEAWSGIANGSNLVLETTVNGGQVRSAALTLDNNKNATFTGNVYAPSLALTVSPLSFTSGGTNGSYSTANQAFNALSPLTTNGDIITRSGGINSRLAVGSETKVLKVVSGAPAYAEEDRSNLLVNPNFEDVALTGWTCTTGTCASTTTSGEFSEGLAALKITTAGGGGGVINVSQAPTIIAGSIAQHVVGVNYKWLSTDIVDFQICTTVNGSEKTCVPTANLIGDNSYHTIEIPEVATPGQSLGIKFKSTTNAVSKNVYVDKAYIKQGLGTQALQLDNVYSAQSSSAGVVSNLNKAGWISNCVITATSTYTCPLNAFTVSPNCEVTATGYVAQISSTSSSQIVIQTFNSTNAAALAQPFSVICQKSGNDYLASSSAVYSQASANTEYVSYTPTSGFTNTTCVGKWKRTGDSMDIYSTCTLTGTPTGSATITLPSGYTIDTSKLSGGASTNTPIGSGFLNQTGSAFWESIVVYDPGVSLIVGYGYNVANRVNASVPFTWGNTHWYSYHVTVPIVGWSNSSQIVGSFAGYTNVPGYQGNVDTFSVSYGTTNATTVCSASPCSYLDQIGSAVSSVTRSGVGAYSLNTAKTYSKLKCVSGVINNNLQGRYIDGINCSNCAGGTFGSWAVTLVTNAGDSYGTLYCQGTY